MKQLAAMIVPPDPATKGHRIRVWIRVAHEARQHPSGPQRCSAAFTTHRLGSARGNHLKAIGLSQAGEAYVETYFDLSIGRYRLAAAIEEPRWLSVQGVLHIEVPSRDRPLLTWRCPHPSPQNGTTLLPLWGGAQDVPLMSWGRNVAAPCCRLPGSPLLQTRRYSIAIVSPENSLNCRLNGRAFKITPATYMVVPPGSALLLAERLLRPAVFDVWFIGQAVLRSVREELGLPQTLGPFNFSPTPRLLTPALRTRLEDVRSALERQREFGGAALALHAARAMMTSLLQTHPNELKERHQARKRKDPRVAQVLRWLDDHLAQPIEIRRIADDLGFSYDHLRDLFRQEAGRSLIQELTIRRVAKAEALLKNHDLSVDEAACQVGFKDARGLYKAFQRVRGHTPSQVRK